MNFVVIFRQKVKENPKMSQMLPRFTRLGTFDHQTSDAQAGQAEIYYGRAELRHGNTSIKPLRKIIFKHSMTQRFL